MNSTTKGWLLSPSRRCGCLASTALAAAESMQPSLYVDNNSNQPQKRSTMILCFSAPPLKIGRTTSKWWAKSTKLVMQSMISLHKVEIASPRSCADSISFSNVSPLDLVYFSMAFLRATSPALLFLFMRKASTRMSKCFFWENCCTVTMISRSPMRKRL